MDVIVEFLMLNENKELIIKSSGVDCCLYFDRKFNVWSDRK